MHSENPTFPNILDKKDPDFASFNTTCDNVYTDLKYLLQLILIIVLYVYHNDNYFSLKKNFFVLFLKIYIVLRC